MTKIALLKFRFNYCEKRFKILILSVKHDELLDKSINAQVLTFISYSKIIKALSAC
jgi:hypothetical protein